MSTMFPLLESRLRAQDMVTIELATRQGLLRGALTGLSTEGTNTVLVRITNILLEPATTTHKLTLEQLEGAALHREGACWILKASSV